MQKQVLNPGAQQEKLTMNHCSNYGRVDSTVKIHDSSLLCADLLVV